MEDPPPGVLASVIVAWLLRFYAQKGKMARSPGRVKDSTGGRFGQRPQSPCSTIPRGLTQKTRPGEVGGVLNSTLLFFPSSLPAFQAGLWT